jgi:hypothetical protein
VQYVFGFLIGTFNLLFVKFIRNRILSCFDKPKIKDLGKQLQDSMVYLRLESTWTSASLLCFYGPIINLTIIANDEKKMQSEAGK